VERLCKLLTFVIALFAASSAFAASINPDDVRVIDGDTIRVFHKDPYCPVHRL
jgi:hypothetical protein